MMDLTAGELHATVIDLGGKRRCRQDDWSNKG